MLATMKIESLTAENYNTWKMQMEANDGEKRRMDLCEWYKSEAND